MVGMITCEDSSYLPAVICESRMHKESRGEYREVCSKSKCNSLRKACMDIDVQNIFPWPQYSIMTIISFLTMMYNTQN
jgi:hypothetical protein